MPAEPQDAPSEESRSSAGPMLDLPAPADFLLASQMGQDFFFSQLRQAPVAYVIN